MGRTIVVTSGKGGVGKTTITANIASALAMLKYSVVAIDADIGLRNLDVVMGLENDIVYNLVDVTEKKCRVKQALIKDKRADDLYIIASSQNKDKTSVTPYEMEELTADLRQIFDFTVIDCPAGIEHGFKNAIAGAKEAIVVVTPQVSSVRDADKILNLLDKEPVEEVSLVINRTRADMMKKGEMMSIEDIMDILPAKLLGVVPEDKNVVISTNIGEPLVFTQNQAKSAYFNIAKRLTGQQVPLLGTDKKQSLLKRLAKI